MPTNAIQNLSPKNIPQVSELKNVNNRLVYRVSYFITIFNQNGIYEWELDSSDSFLKSGLKPYRVVTVR